MAEAIIENRRLGSSEPQAAPVAISPTAYRPFTKKLVASLTALGGVLTLGGGLGTWIRVAEQETSRSPFLEVEAVMGYTDPLGLALAALGVLAIAGAFAWGMKGWLPKLIPTIATLAVAGITLVKVPILSRDADSMFQRGLQGLESLEQPFHSMHAGFGWGVWMLIAGAVVLLLGMVAGVLRELDLRKGVGG
ncbi:MAG: hypothetical protein KY429_02345 [Actinobacteria bacterium]|nr:hypothetical protein [Actinomycetota bacterium]